MRRCTRCRLCGFGLSGHSRLPKILDLFLQAPYKDRLFDEGIGRWDEPGVIAVPLEEDGKPFTEHVCDVRDAADAVLLAIESDAAPGQAFNVAGPQSFRYTEVGPMLASKTGLRVVEARCRSIHSYSLSIDKARRLLGYRPRYQVMEAFEEALAAAKTNNREGNVCTTQTLEEKNLKAEIFSAPVVADELARMWSEKRTAIRQMAKEIHARKPRNIVFTASGGSAAALYSGYWAALHYLKLPVNYLLGPDILSVHPAVLDKDSIAITASYSGKTMDTVRTKERF